MRYKILGGVWGESDWIPRRLVYLDEEAARVRYEKGELALVVGPEQFQMYTRKQEIQINTLTKIEDTSNIPTIFRINN